MKRRKLILSALILLGLTITGCDIPVGGNSSKTDKTSTSLTSDISNEQSSSADDKSSNDTSSDSSANTSSSNSSSSSNPSSSSSSASSNKPSSSFSSSSSSSSSSSKPSSTSSKPSSSSSSSSNIPAPTLRGISINTENVKKDYKYAEALDLTGLVVTANYSDNSSVTIDNYTSSPANHTSLTTLGENKVTISYQGFNQQFAVQVEDVLTGIQLDTTNVKKEYVKGEALDLTGLVVTANYLSGASATVDNYTTYPVEGTALNDTGYINVTVSFGGKSSPFMVLVSEPATTNVTIDIFAFNDMHGNVKDTFGKGYGIAKTTTLLKEVSKDKNSVFISEGDMWQGSAESNYTRGKLVTEWMNQLEFVSMTVGNHEFDWGDQAIKDNEQIAEFPTLGINVLKKSDNKRVDYLDASTTFTRGGAKIGVIGAIGNCLSSISSSKVPGLYFAKGDQLTNLVKAEATRLRDEENCDYIIYSIHGSPSRDEADDYDISLSNDHYVDIVLEGHTHTQYCYQDEGGVYHLQGCANNESFLQITVDLDLANDTNTISNVLSYDTSYASAALNDYAEDEDANELFVKYYDDYKICYENLGYNSEFRDANVIRNKVAELYLEYGLAKWGNDYNLVLGGGYMSCRGSGLAEGDVYYSQLAELLPFDNEIVLCSVKGSDFRGTQFVTGSSNYFVDWTSYGNGVRDNIDDNATYYLVTDTYNSDYSYNHLTVIDTLEFGGMYARDLIAQYIKDGNWDNRVPIETIHAGTVDDPKTIAEALEIAAQYSGSSASNAGAPYFYFKGYVSTTPNRIGSSGDLGNVKVNDGLGTTEILIYWLAKTENRNPNWTSVDDLSIGDELVFYGAPFSYNGTTKEFSGGTYVYSINGVPTAQ